MVVGAGAFALTFFLPTLAGSALPAAEARKSISPRIAAWQERKTEELQFEERARQAAVKPVAAVNPVSAPAAPKRDGFAEERALKAAEKERATRIAQAKRQAAKHRRDNTDSYALGYAPAPSGGFGNRYFAIRDAQSN